MIETTDRLDAESLARFDDIIDVRSPAEFAEDHVPGAINLPVLDNEQRAEVGTIYVRQSRFLARRVGAAHVARNIAAHLDGPLADRPASYAPLIYCWRGGQRSLAMATVLSQVGWRPSLAAGGYRTYRRAVTAALYDAEREPGLVLLDGYTGSAKTEVLHRLAALGVQVLDLEGLAGHRGSLFGGFAGRAQPSQKMFESRLLLALGALDPARPIVVEAESSKIGQIMVPPLLWRAMGRAPRIEVLAPRPARARYLVSAYADLTADPAALADALAALPGRYGAKRVSEWSLMAEEGRFLELAESLVEMHYDPAYERSSRRDERPRLGTISMEDLGAADLERAAGQIAGLVAARGEPCGG
jgi:tRNA 2-selenouridine synthase